jgi:hypothetical protein
MSGLIGQVGARSGVVGTTEIDYEEGTFSPTYYATGTAITSIVYHAQTGGRYTKVGNLVHFQATLRMGAGSNIGSPTGVLRMGGLPFTCIANSGSTADGDSAVSIGWSDNFNTTPTNATVISGQSNIDLNYQATHGSDFTSVPPSALTGVNGDDWMQIAGTYIAA